LKTVRIKWSRDYCTEESWDRVCIWAIERFGLPGGLYTTQLNIDYMDFVFNNKNDALIMALMWNGQIVSDEELTVEFVGRFI